MYMHIIINNTGNDNNKHNDW